MRTTGLIAGGVGITLVLGVLVLAAVIGVIALAVWAPAGRAAAADVRAAIVDHRDDLAFCGAGERGGRMVATVVLERGEPTHIGIGDASVPAAVAHCVAETLVAASWPRISAAASVPLVFE